MDIAKRLIDYGFHPYTTAFPLIVPGAMMIEPTESESKEEMDLFIEAMQSIAQEVEEDAEMVRSAPHRPGFRALTKPPPRETQCCAGNRRSNPNKS